MSKRISYLICTLAAIFVSASCIGKETPSGPKQPEEVTDYSPAAVRKVLDEEQKAAFMHSWKTADENGMIHASSNVHNPKVTTGGSGFAVMSTIVGVERGWITRAQGLDRIVRVVNFLKKAERMHGVWSHWMNPDGTPAKFGNQIEAGDLVETSFMMMGLFCAQEYFSGTGNKEKKLRADIDELWNGIDWNFYTAGGDFIYWGWDRTTEEYFLPLKAYNEGLITYIMALGAEGGYAVDSGVYASGWWGNPNSYKPNRKYYGYSLPLGGPYDGPMFLSHYSFLGMNPRNMQDAKVHYFHNGIRHAMVQRHYCMYEAPKEYGYNEFNWGLSACNGPKGKGYKARAPHRDDGVIAPTAALASMPYVPFYSIQVLLELHYNHPELHTQYGFGDSYSMVDNWAEKGIIAIDREPIVIMIENYRSGLMWKLLEDNEIIRRGLSRTDIGRPVYETGFQHAIADNVSGAYDMIRHPDREKYELDFYLSEGAEVTFRIFGADGGIVADIPAETYASGEHILSFDYENIRRGDIHTMEMTVKGRQEPITLPVRLN